MRRRRLNFILSIQLVLFVAHALVFATWTSFWGADAFGGVSGLAVAFAFLSVSFVGASLLAFRYYHIFVRAFYTVAAAWLGILNYCFLASLACWIVYPVVRFGGFRWPSRDLSAVLFGCAFLTAAYGIANSFFLRVRRLDVTIPNLPSAWRGRVAALISDTHLGPVRGAGFSRRIVSLLNRLQPDVVFLTGDFYDGTAADLTGFASPLASLTASLGAYFVTGNHEEFTIAQKYVEALAKAGVRVLHIETVNVDGLQIIGIPYHEMATSDRFRAALRSTGFDPPCPAFCSFMRPTGSGKRSKPASHFNSPATLTEANSFPGRAWSAACTANLPTACKS